MPNRAIQFLFREQLEIMASLFSPHVTNLVLQQTIQSDVAPLNGLIQSLLEASDKVHVLRDPTRGGVGTTLNEIAGQSKVRIILDETTLPIRAEVQGACDLLGFDPLYVANEGKVIVISDPTDDDAVLAALKNHPLGKDAVKIGTVANTDNNSPVVLMKTVIGGTRVVDMLTGAMLPQDLLKQTPLDINLLHFILTK